MGTALVVVAVGVLLCFFGIRSVNLALLASGFAVGYLAGDALGESTGTALLVGGITAVLVWLVVSLVFRFAAVVVGLVAGAVIGAKLWSALATDGTSAVLGLVLVAAVAVASATLAEKYRRRALLWLTVLGGASVILTGLALLWPSTLGFLRRPDEGAEQVLLLVVWLAVAAAGWVVQRRLFRKQLGLPPREPATV
ncbi:hypothetical protein [Cellulomonas fimi]|uniref:DUF4203 domain-containing protein n=1 Tax=Cellulomonas fimi (strain ATCC 484 / DSM 20113 / JCM 1341 / CCUG 24087 / LMG 16345 / NBRC 15513 / NCIMB 8980 / NCTC 7547 / NRS-133) TaxID=590998 RepID=F4H8B4_CELFA|nr:hypothetical protein [Cellulomonas fimi]AEE44671.1 hypothetical protein Celf_0531 [Cellulomonas fimi ATCC 484]NNH07483.1 DUF4203 domain-containing protein [Cellulomonas fimi]VEH26962.1 Uncharacterised protein [Cellulomonas fimi]